MASFQMFSLRLSNQYDDSVLCSQCQQIRSAVPVHPPDQYFYIDKVGSVIMLIKIVEII